MNIPKQAISNIIDIKELVPHEKSKKIKSTSHITEQKECNYLVNII